MLLKLFLAFTIIPVVEIYLLIQIGTIFGALTSIALVIVTGFLGAPNSGTSEGLGNPGLGNWISAEGLDRGGKATKTGSLLSSESPTPGGNPGSGSLISPGFGNGGGENPTGLAGTGTGGEGVSGVGFGLAGTAGTGAGATTLGTSGVAGTGIASIGAGVVSSTELETKSVAGKLVNFADNSCTKAD